MTRYQSWLFATALLFTLACGDQKPKPAAAEYVPYFPVNAFLLEQLHQIDSLKPPTVLYTENGKDSSVQGIELSTVRAMAAPFLQYDISVSPLHDQYKEESFADQSIPAITFTYTTVDSSLPLQRVDVILKPDPVKADKVKSIYMEKFYAQGDSAITEKLYWKADHFYQVIRTAGAGGKEITTRQKVVWNPAE
ncbi:MAG TPA: hypothetical protein PLQ65_11995 [Flavihumibacter sp.]|nr:hypothetical protein [Bacteroidota bacterium]HOA39137.1 hypothetical protein [Flavihumibacter sp.]HQD10381.1 hypothetical protein [Flavihumibacter sp.]